MKSLADRVLELVPGAVGGLSLKAAVAALGHDVAHTRAAFERLDQSGRARLFRRGRGGALYLVPAGTPLLICAKAGCGREFKRPPKSKRVTCSRTCSSSYGWRDPEKAAKRNAAIAAVAKTPRRQAALAAHNARRWADPQQHANLAAQNSREWKDPEKAAVRAAKIRLKNGRPEARKKISDLRKAEWDDPATRAMRLEGQNKSKRTQAYRDKMRRLAIERNKSPAFRALVSARNKASANDPILKARRSATMKALWADPVWRAATGAKISKSRKKAHLAKMRQNAN